MPNTKNKHPALAQQVERGNEAIREKIAETVGDIEGWNKFQPSWRKVLAVMPLYGDIAGACRHAGVSVRAFYTAMATTPALKNAVNNRTVFTMSIMQRIAADALAESMDKTVTLARGGIDEYKVPISHTTQLTAIKVIMDVNKVGVDQQASGPTIQINTQVIVPSGRSEDTREVIVVDTD